MNKLLLCLVLILGGCATTSQIPPVNTINKVVCEIPESLLQEPNPPVIPLIKNQKDLAIFLGSDVAIYVNSLKGTLKKISTYNKKCIEDNK